MTSGSSLIGPRSLHAFVIPLSAPLLRAPGVLCGTEEPQMSAAEAKGALTHTLVEHLPSYAFLLIWILCLFHH